MNSLYKFLGLNSSLINVEIPIRIIFENASEKDRDNLGWALTNVDSVCLKLSVERNGEYLQVIEVDLNTPEEIDKIAKFIQRTIKYKILFVFEYQSRYLVLWRNFKITDSSGYVYTDNTTYCTDWIYEEELSSDTIWSCATSEIDFSLPEQAKFKKLIFTNAKKSVTTCFSDILRNVIEVNRSMITSELISYRHFADWFSTHALGERIDMVDAIHKAEKGDAVYEIDEHLFFDKNQLSFICAELDHSFYIVEVGRTGRIPMRYFEGGITVATFDNESDIVVWRSLQEHIQNYNDIDDFIDYRDVGDNIAREVIKKLS